MTWIKPNSLKNLNVTQWGALWRAYWRLWLVQIKIKWGKSGWWLSKVQLKENAQDNAPIDDRPDKHNGLSKDADQLFELVRLAARMHLWQTACLPKSIVLADMLNVKHGENRALVVLGVQRLDAGKTDRPIAGHAWVELNGVIIGEPGSIGEQFTKISKS